MNELEVCGAPVHDRHFSSIFKCLSGTDGLLAKDEFAGAFTRGNKCVEEAKNGHKDHDSNSEEEEEKNDRVSFPRNAAEAGLFYDKCNTD